MLLRPQALAGNSMIHCPWLLTCRTCCLYCCDLALPQFSVLRYESVIHEFDPYFNYRSTIKASLTLQPAAADMLISAIQIQLH
jgi:hypothetical protein